VHFVRYGKLWVVNTYVPNGNGKDRDNSRIPYKLAFWQRLFDLLEPMKKSGERILVMGDLNTSPEDIDLARPKQNHKTSGFTPIERDSVRFWLENGWVDTFRHLAFDEGIEENGAHDEGPGMPGGPGDGLMDTAPALPGQPPRVWIAEERVGAIRLHRAVQGDPERGRLVLRQRDRLRNELPENER